MKYQSLFSEKSKKKYFKMSSAELFTQCAELQNGIIDTKTYNEM